MRATAVVPGFPSFSSISSTEEVPLKRPQPQHITALRAPAAVPMPITSNISSIEDTPLNYSQLERIAQGKMFRFGNMETTKRYEQLRESTLARTQLQRVKSQLKPRERITRPEDLKELEVLFEDVDRHRNRPFKRASLQPSSQHIAELRAPAVVPSASSISNTEKVPLTYPQPQRIAKSSATTIVPSPASVFSAESLKLQSLPNFLGELRLAILGATATVPRPTNTSGAESSKLCLPKFLSELRSAILNPAAVAPSPASILSKEDPQSERHYCIADTSSPSMPSTPPSAPNFGTRSDLTAVTSDASTISSASSVSDTEKKSKRSKDLKPIKDRNSAELVSYRMEIAAEDTLKKRKDNGHRKDKRVRFDKRDRGMVAEPDDSLATLIGIDEKQALQQPLKDHEVQASRSPQEVEKEAFSFSETKAQQHTPPTTSVNIPVHLALPVVTRSVSQGTSLNQQVLELRHQIQQNRRVVYGGIAAAMAMPTVMPSAGKTAIVVGGAHFRGENAMGIAAAWRSLCGQTQINMALSASAAAVGVRVQVAREF